MYHIQNLKLKRKNCLISSRFAPINKKKIVSEETRAQSHGTEAPKQPKRCHQKYALQEKILKDKPSSVAF